MNPENLLSYYPNYALLDEAMASGTFKNLNIYLDLKNCLKGSYIKDIIHCLVENTKKAKYIDPSIFTSLLSFIAFHKLYAAKRKIHLNFFVFLEVGTSYYHTNIDKNYKSSRKISNLFDLSIEDRDLFEDIKNKNFHIIEGFFNKFPNVKVIKCTNLEADFIPYYLVRNRLVDVTDETMHLLYSSDHDMLQCVKKNVFVFRKLKNGKHLIKPGQVMTEEMGVRNDIPDIYHPLSLAIIGDTGDDVTGIKGLAEKTFVKIFPELRRTLKPVRDLYESVMNGEDIFVKGSGEKNVRKIIEAEKKEGLISKNLKLVSFELLSRALDYPRSSEIMEKKNYILNVMRGEDIIPVETARLLLEKNGIMVFGEELDLIYFGGC